MQRHTQLKPISLEAGELGADLIGGWGGGHVLGLVAPVEHAADEEGLAVEEDVAVPLPAG
jgi:hypothetical protein